MGEKQTAEFLIAEPYRGNEKMSPQSKQDS